MQQIAITTHCVPQLKGVGPRAETVINLYQYQIMALASVLMGHQAGGSSTIPYKYIYSGGSDTEQRNNEHIGILNILKFGFRMVQNKMVTILFGFPMARTIGKPIFQLA